MKTKTIIIIGIIIGVLIIAATVTTVVLMDGTHDKDAGEYSLTADEIGTGWIITSERDTEGVQGFNIILGFGSG